MKAIAAIVGRSDLYGFLYHATSRLVHFSVPELMRRVWGKPGKMEVAADFFERYWAEFAIYWGGWIFGQTFALVGPELTSLSEDFEEYDLAPFERAVKALLRKGGIPIITVEEIAWPIKYGSEEVQ